MAYMLQSDYHGRIMPQTTIGIIGGTGLYELPGLTEMRQVSVDTPFGSPSSLVTEGLLNGVRLLFIARHGEGHVYLPSEVPYRANIFALKMLGAQWCLSISAVGSLKEEFAPGDLVLPHQFIDRTKKRTDTFFGNGICAHVPFAAPVCPVMHQELCHAAKESAAEKSVRVHSAATYICMEGPAFSSRAESLLYRQLGAEIIGMTALPEAKLAREAELAYAMLALVTDYDCWKHRDADVEIGEILEVLRQNVALARDIAAKAVLRLSMTSPSSLAADALAAAIVTAPDKIPADLKQSLSPIIGRYIKQSL